MFILSANYIKPSHERRVKNTEVLNMKADDACSGHCTLKG
jgi:hypothetical protein